MASLNLRKGIYHTNFVGKRGNRIRVSTKQSDKTKALIILAKLIEKDMQETKQHLTQKPETVLPDNLLLRDFAPEYLKYHKTITREGTHYLTCLMVNKHILPMFGDRRLDSLNMLDGEALMQARKNDGKSSHTIVRTLSVFNALMNRAIKLKYIPGHNVNDITLPKNVNSKPGGYYVADELARLYMSDYGLLWKLFVNTGFRQADMRQFKWSYVDWTDNKIKLPSSEFESTKSGEDRILPLFPGAKNALILLKAKQNAHNVYVFEPAHKNRLSFLFRQEKDRLDLPGTLHRTRHTFATTLALKGEPLVNIQRWMGHADVKTTMTYIHASREDRSAVYDKYKF